jgi:hypothetical protein
MAPQCKNRVTPVLACYVFYVTVSTATHVLKRVDGLWSLWHVCRSGKSWREGCHILWGSYLSRTVICIDQSRLNGIITEEIIILIFTATGASNLKLFSICNLILLSNVIRYVTSPRRHNCRLVYVAVPLVTQSDCSLQRIWQVCLIISFPNLNTTKKINFFKLYKAGLFLKIGQSQLQNLLPLTPSFATIINKTKVNRPRCNSSAVWGISGILSYFKMIKKHDDYSIRNTI